MTISVICEEFKTNDNRCKTNDKMNVLNKIMLCLAVGWVQELAIPIVPRVLKHASIDTSHYLVRNLQIGYRLPVAYCR